MIVFNVWSMGHMYSICWVYNIHLMSVCSVCCTHRRCSVCCVWYILCECVPCVACVLHVACIVWGPGNGHVWHIWPFAWQTLVIWRKGYHSSVKDSGHTVPDGWLVSWRPICVCFPAFSIRQREAALVWPTGVVCNHPRPCSRAWVFSYFSLL